jgi:hypothetical protein
MSDEQDLSLSPKTWAIIIGGAVVATVIGAWVAIRLARPNVKPPTNSGVSLAPSRISGSPADSVQSPAIPASTRPTRVIAASLATHPSTMPVAAHADNDSTAETPEDLERKLKTFTQRLPTALAKASADEDRRRQELLRRDGQRADDLVYKYEYDIVRTDIVKTDSALHPMCGEVVVREHCTITGENNYYNASSSELTLTLALTGKQWKLVKAMSEAGPTLTETLAGKTDVRTKVDATNSPYIASGVKGAN